jgi:hypothetical protein
MSKSYYKIWLKDKGLRGLRGSAEGMSNGYQKEENYIKRSLIIIRKSVQSMT